MRQRISAAVLIGAAVLMLCGCTVQKAFKPESYNSLKPGMSKAEVQERMGPPIGTENTPGMEIWKYERHDPITSTYELIQLRFENGVYKDMSRSQPKEPWN